MGPLDLAFRSLSGRGRLPPLWLRRHAGPVSNFESASRETAAYLRQTNLLRTDAHVLDVGCGPGAMALELAPLLGPAGRYTGFDVHRPSVRWCMRRFAADPRFRFEAVDVATPWSRRAEGPPDSLRFPAEDGQTDLALAKSFFTHLLEPEARRCLAEIRRVLAPRGAAFLTAFLFREGGATPFFPCPGNGALVRWRSAARPQAAVAYARVLFSSMVEEAGLRVRGIHEGFWPGDTNRMTGQDILILERG